MYISIDKVRYLCNKIGSQQVPDVEVEEFIKKACDRIDPVLATRYRLPLPTPIPGIIESIAQDFAASFILDKYYPGSNTKEQIPLSKVYFDRADSDLKQIIEFGLLDKIPGVVMVSHTESMGKSCIKSTTYQRSRKPSMMENAINKF